MGRSANPSTSTRRDMYLGYVSHPDPASHAARLEGISPGHGPEVHVPWQRRRRSSASVVGRFMWSANGNMDRVFHSR